MSDLSNLTEQERNLATLPHAGTYHVHQGTYMGQIAHYVFTPKNTEPVCAVLSYAPVPLTAEAIALALNVGPQACKALNDARAEVETLKEERARARAKAYLIGMAVVPRDRLTELMKAEAERDAVRERAEDAEGKLRICEERVRIAEADLRRVRGHYVSQGVMPIQLSDKAIDGEASDG